MTVKLFEHQTDALDRTQQFNRVAYFHDMGLGKTYTGGEKMNQLGGQLNLVICQKSKIDDWIDHFKVNYPDWDVWNLTTLGGMKAFESNRLMVHSGTFRMVGVINYDLIYRRPDLKKIHYDTVMLDESSLIQNERTKRSKFILGLSTTNVVLLSGTPVGGKYEKLWSQLHLLGWDIKKSTFMDHYVDHYWNHDQGFPICVIKGYKNIDRLKMKMAEYGCDFLKTESVLNLPQQFESTVSVKNSKEYNTFRKTRVVDVGDVHLVGDTTLTKMLYERQLCGAHNKAKLEAFRDLLESTTDRLIVFYNFTSELEKLKQIALDYTDHISEVNGSVKDLAAYEEHSDSITFLQYQSGSMGLNLQKCCRTIYFTPPLSSELFEQSKKRTNRIGQDRPCWYYYLTCKNSVEERIYKTLAMRKDFTERLFEVQENE